MVSRERVEELARDFWAEAGLPASFPRDIGRAVALVLPVTLVVLSRLASDTIGEWLRLRRIRIEVPAGHDDLMGCIVARNGHAFILVAGTDPEEERRLTIAHEVAHLIVHYLLPRGGVIAALGPEIVDVLDGRRSPTLAERAAAVLSAVHLGPHVHLMPRRGSGSSALLRVEDEADALALELLAPEAAITEFLRSPVAARVSAAEQCQALGAHFGLPHHCFEAIVAAWQRRTRASFVGEIAAVLRERQP